MELLEMTVSRTIGRLMTVSPARRAYDLGTMSI